MLKAVVIIISLLFVICSSLVAIFFWSLKKVFFISGLVLTPLSGTLKKNCGFPDANQKRTEKLGF